ncbi:MAG: hypothetical protein ACK5MB_00610, partial [Phycisphaerales bacterium]
GGGRGERAGKKAELGALERAEFQAAADIDAPVAELAATDGAGRIDLSVRLSAGVPLRAIGG